MTVHRSTSCLHLVLKIAPEISVWLYFYGSWLGNPGIHPPRAWAVLTGAVRVVQYLSRGIFSLCPVFLCHQMTKLNIQTLFCVCCCTWTDSFNQLHEWAFKGFISQNGQIMVIRRLCCYPGCRAIRRLKEYCQGDKGTRLSYLKPVIFCHIYLNTLILECSFSLYLISWHLEAERRGRMVQMCGVKSVSASWVCLLNTVR